MAPLSYCNYIVTKWVFLVNHKKNPTQGRVYCSTTRTDFYFFSAGFAAGAAGAAGAAAGLAASFFGSSFFAGADCATADTANADATIANNAFMLFPFESKLMAGESNHLHI
jgi:hypothetical protein